MRGSLVVLAMPDAPCRPRVNASCPMLAIHAEPGERVRLSLHRLQDLHCRAVRARPAGTRRDRGRVRVCVERFAEEDRTSRGVVDACRSVVARHAEPRRSVDGLHTSSPLFGDLGLCVGTRPCGIRAFAPFVPVHVRRDEGAWKGQTSAAVFRGRARCSGEVGRFEPPGRITPIVGGSG
jgi:hypothetical protein